MEASRLKSTLRMLGHNIAQRVLKHLHHMPKHTMPLLDGIDYEFVGGHGIVILTKIFSNREAGASGA